MNDSNLMDELKALRVQEWMQREHDLLVPVQEIEEAMRAPCSCRFVEAHFDAIRSGYVSVPVKPPASVIEGIARANAGRPSDWPDAYDKRAQTIRRANAECSYLEVIEASPAKAIG